MSSFLPSAPVFVVVVSMDGCGACEDYVPRITSLAGAYQRAGLPVVFLKADDNRPETQQWMDGYGVSAVPATIVVSSKAFATGVWKADGAQDDGTIRSILDFAYALRQR